MNGITVVVPTIRERAEFLGRAMASVSTQTEPPDATLVVMDTDRSGAAAVRDRGLRMVTTPWVAFLDDDDELYPQHLQHLFLLAERKKADMVFPWYDCSARDPFPQNEFREYDVNDPHQTTVTMLVKTEAALAVGGFVDEPDPEWDPGLDEGGHRAGEEYRFVRRLALADYRIVHLHERTWKWRHHGRNTMGLPSRVR